MSSAINPLTSPASATSATQTGSSPSPAQDPLANESTFLTLLVSQLKNQDPLSPVDSNQFVAQLTSYSQLEQLIGIHKDTTSLSQAVTATPSPVTAEVPATSTAASTTSPTNSTTGATN